MDLKQLEYFVRVAEMGSFTRAAHALNVAQPALSRQIRQLEVELRQHLLLRNGRGAVPTEAGKVLLAHARGILHQVVRAQEDLGQLRGAPAGRVAIGLPPSLARVLTVPLTRAFRQALPQATLSIAEALSAALLEQLLQGRLDLALLYNPPPVPDVGYTPLFQETLFLLQAQQPDASTVAPAAPIALTEVARLPLIIPSRPNAIRMQVESTMAAIGVRPQIAMEIDGVAAILELVADGMGYAVLSRSAIAHGARPGALYMRPIVAPPLRAHVALAKSERRPTTPTQNAAAALIERLCAAHFDAARA